jgi:hypothetical protein
MQNNGTANKQENKMNSTQIPERLKLGKGIVGPDWPGCVNSGAAPVLLKSKVAKLYLDKQY